MHERRMGRMARASVWNGGGAWGGHAAVRLLVTVFLCCSSKSFSGAFHPSFFWSSAAVRRPVWHERVCWYDAAHFDASTSKCTASKCAASYQKNGRFMGLRPVSSRQRSSQEDLSTLGGLDRFLELYNGTFHNIAQARKEPGTILSRKEHRRVSLPQLGLCFLLDSCRQICNSAGACAIVHRVVVLCWSIQFSTRFNVFQIFAQLHV